MIYLIPKGLVLRINGVDKRYTGFLAFCLGDTPAMNWLGGFKESVGSSIKYCRTCEVIKERVVDGQGRKELSRRIVPRTLKNHLITLGKMKTGTAEENKELSKSQSKIKT